MSQPGPAGRTLLEADELSSIVRKFGQAISADHPDGIVLVGILKGSVCLVADLAREISVPCAVDFLALSAYGAGGARIKLSKDLEADVAGRAVVIAVDIVDSGLTVSYVRRLLNRAGRSLRRRVHVVGPAAAPACCPSTFDMWASRSATSTWWDTASTSRSDTGTFRRLSSSSPRISFERAVGICGRDRECAGPSGPLTFVAWWKFGSPAFEST